ncbi:apolipoprotein N-acyltransferase [Helicobacter baculiformis]|uniref:Apolipoprotein N-acyltransferase n=1 Tax=Helicobacter baculiformis TaxID=427351 RepID=A0ABV7ZEF5_9HELI|nr:apolipoprotein N-acyltransferase [Helicobacter baculiformis]
MWGWLLSHTHWGLALLFLAPVYVGSMLTKHPLILTGAQSLLAPLSIFACLQVEKQRSFSFGFLVGLGLFYWCALSFRYSDYAFLIPLMMILIALCYGGVFYLLCWRSSPIYRVLTLWLASYIHPFGFDWFVPESLFAYSVFKVDKLSFLCVLMAIALLKPHENERFLFLKTSTHLYPKLLACTLFALSLDWHASNVPHNTFSQFKVATTHTAQDLKWQQQHLEEIVNHNLEMIRRAIAQQKQVVILPETAFPFVLNTSNLLPTLLELSAHITIITGALTQADHTLYNSTYVFANKSYQYAHKVILAPFGEKMPLPKFLADYLEKVFFGASSFSLGSGASFRDFDIQGFKFRPLVCYEGTSALAYPHSPDTFVVISNNAWFVPSIEPFLQRMLLKYYARRFHKTIIHSTNLSPSYILTPTLLGDQNKGF